MKQNIKYVSIGMYKQLEEENKKLKAYADNLDSENDNQAIEIEELKEENKKLKEKNEKLEEDNINLISFNEHYSPDVIVKYEDRYETAYNEECIENAKLCDKMRRLEEENKKLKSDLSECECSFGFESDEVGFWKGEYKRLKKWIKDHCKGYGNLFPEDEMKRQWKKADKKRK